ASSDLNPGMTTRATSATRSRERHPLFGLAPGGVWRAPSVTRRAVGSYPTVSPLLAYNTQAASAKSAAAYLARFRSLGVLRSGRSVLCATFLRLAPTGR